MITAFIRGLISRKEEEALLLTAHALTYELPVPEYVEIKAEAGSQRVVFPHQDYPQVTTYGLVKVEVRVEFATYVADAHFAAGSLCRFLPFNASLIDEFGWKRVESVYELLSDQLAQTRLICDYWKASFRQLAPQDARIRRLIEALEPLRAAA